VTARSPSLLTEITAKFPLGKFVIPAKDALICVQSPLDLGKEKSRTIPAATLATAIVIITRRMLLLPVILLAVLMA
jgi:hypothetical protein